MYSGLIALLNVLNALSPLAVIALLVLVLAYVIKHDRGLIKMRSNDLHELPDMSIGLKTINDTLQRIELSQAEHFAHIVAKLDNGFISCPFIKK